MAGSGHGQGKAGVARPPAAAAPDPDATGAHPTTGLNETVHQRHRLGILAITSKARQADFGYLR